MTKPQREIVGAVLDCIFCLIIVGILIYGLL